MILLRETRDGVVLPVRAVPGAAKSRLSGEHDGRLKIAIAAVPDRGKANRELVDYLADVLEVKRSTVRLVLGEKDRRKELCIAGMTGEVIASRLRALGLCCSVARNATR